MTVGTRIALFLVLSAGLVGMFAHYDVTEPTDERYPAPSAIERDYDANVGAEVLLWGSVMSVAATERTANISVLTANGTMALTVENFDATVQPGGDVQVYGRLRPERTVDATRVVVVNSAGSSTLYKYLVSMVGGLLVVGQFFRHWTVDWEAFAFEVRHDG